MKKSHIYLLALPALVVGCMRAHFPLIAAQDAAVAQDAGRDGPHADVGTVDAGVCQAPDVACAAPTPSNGICDPVCQTGPCKWCQGEKCSIAGDGKFICTSSGTGTVGQAGCLVTYSGEPNQFDNCSLGLICLSASGTSNTQCFSLCGSDPDCKGNVACTPRPVASGSAPPVNVCDPPYGICPLSCCDPIGNKGCLTQQTCYVVTNVAKTTTNRTVCEYVSGQTRNGSPCTYSRECLRGSMCTDGGFCRVVCDRTAPIPCASNADCTAYGDQYGYCSF